METAPSSFEAIETRLRAVFDAGAVKLDGDKLTVTGRALPLSLLVDIGIDETIARELSSGVDALGFDTLSVERDIAGGFGLTLRFAGEWDLGAGTTFHLDGLSVHVTGGLVDAEAGGHVVLDGVRIAAQVSLPDLIVDGWLAPDEESDLGALLAARKLLPPGTHGTPVVKLFSMRLAPRFGRYETYVDLRDVLELGAGFEVTRLQVELGYQSGPTGDAHGRAWADATLSIPRRSGPPTKLDAALFADIAPGNWVFEGDVVLADGPDMGELMEAVTGRSAEALGVPAMIAECRITALSLRYASEGHDLSVSASLVWPQDALSLRVTLHRSDGDFRVSGHLEHGRSVFDLVFSKTASSPPVLLGTYTASGNDPVGLADLVAAVSRDGHAKAVPEALNANLRDALLAATSPTKMLMTATVDAGFDLSALTSVPFVGGLLPDVQSIGVRLHPALALSPAEDDWSEDDLKSVRDLAPAGAKVPDAISAPLTLVAELKLGGGETRDIGLALPADTAPAQPGPATAPASDSVADGLQWIEIGRSLGPLHVDRVGFAADPSARSVALALDAELSIAGLTLGADGLGMRYELESGEVSAFIRGFGVDFSRGPIAFGGAFLNADGDFLGKVSVKTPTFALTALGGLTMLDHAPSLFLYALLDYPLGGPSFFYVTGLAGGFGLHRKLAMPPLQKVPDFPLVSDAISPPANPSSDPATQLARLHDYVHPHLGEYFIAAGIKFTSFKLIDCFVLVVVEVGEHFEVDLVGHATYQTPPVVPPGLPPVARIEMDLLGRFAPDEGVVSVAARVSSGSFVYSGLCQVFGGFAFSTWFGADKTGSGEDHSGDFVLSVGGYHPAFGKPAHYPEVGRVGMRYQVSEHVSIAGTCYLALTPSVFMAGGAVHGRAEVGAASAWFDLSLDLLIGWEPYHYDLRAHIGIGAQWKCFSLDASADLHLWGPDFSGRAEISWTVFSFDVEFGAAGVGGPVPIDWAHFRRSFLPDDDASLVSVRTAAGLVRTIGTRDVVNPSELTLAITSTVPLSRATFNGAAIEGVVGGFGIAPMDLATLDTTLAIRLEHAIGDGVFRDVPVHTMVHGGNKAEALFAVRTLEKSFPPALWGTSIGADMNRTPIKATGEITLHPWRAPMSGHVDTFSRKDIDYVVDRHAVSAVAAKVPDWKPADVSSAARLATALGTAPKGKGAKARASLAAALGLDGDEIALSAGYARSLRQMPLAAEPSVAARAERIA